jgi:hypothetical protein
MVGEIGDRAPVRLLTKRLAFLWGVTCAGRILYMLAPLSYATLRPFLELAFFAFLLTISAMEILILRTAAAAYKDFIQPPRRGESSKPSKSTAIYPLRLKLVFALFIFCLIMGLWDARNDNQMVLPSVVGVATNFWWVWIFAAPKLRLNEQSNG